MDFEEFSFGSLRIDGITYEHDVVIDRTEIRKRKKKASKKFRDAYGHTPLSTEEDIPWKCRRLVVGTGAYGNLPVMKQVKLAAAHRKIELLIFPTAQAIEALKRNPEETNAILHVTC
jgi:hypothetical protein